MSLKILLAHLAAQTENQVGENSVAARHKEKDETKPEGVEEMTDELIEKCLEYCVDKRCQECAHQNELYCNRVLMTDALDYINRLKEKSKARGEMNNRLLKMFGDLTQAKNFVEIYTTSEMVEHIREETRKETAKEIFDYIYKSGVINVAPDTIKMFFKEKYGVEVEE